jgi:outer membrane protein OmpA-like peptidoglycan-associated protein
MTKRLLACLAAVAALSARDAAAEDPTERGFDADPSRLALSLDGGFAVETASAEPRGTFGLAAIFDYADGLLALELGGERRDLLESRLSGHLLGGWSLGRVELSAHVPVALWQRSDFSLLTDPPMSVTGPLVAPIERTALGDLRLGAKVPILDAARFPIGLAALLDARLPTGDRDAFAGDGPALVPSAVVTRAFGPLRIDAQLGYVVRGRGQYAQLVVHDGFTYGAGGSLELPSLALVERWRAIAEITGGWPRGYDLDGARYRAPLAARAGLRAWLTHALSVEVGGGAGLGEAGYGHERWRVFAGVRWRQTPLGRPDEDFDRDGVANLKDLCPRDAGPAELDGCPDVDLDLIPDREDRCPREPGPAENEGCPVSVDEPVVEIETEKLSLKDSIQFDSGRDSIKAGSFRVLDQIAKLLLEHPEFSRIRVDGHTDNVGGAAYNKDLSERRARSVVRYLVDKGVAKERLSSAGFGFERPVASNATALGRAKNRRVEFTILAE